MSWLKWLLILVIAAIAVWLMSGKKDIQTLINPKATDEKDTSEIAGKIREKMRKIQLK